MSKNNTLHYLDYAATTPADPRVIESMVACLGADGAFGNPASSSHAAGRQARAKVERARAQVAALIGADADEIVWTSGATESNNLALKGYADAAVEKRHLITSRIEHKAILDTMASLSKQGMSVTCLTPTSDGEITADAVAAAIGPDTGLVSLMLVNNEIGTLTDIGAIARVVHAAGALLHVDAAQALGKTPIDVRALGIDMMSMSAHKFYGPKGIGALFVRRDIADRIAPQMHGGGHERGLRSGTLATHQIVGMGTACELAAEGLETEAARIAVLSTRLKDGVLALGDVTQNASAARRIPHTLSLTVTAPGFFPFMLGDALAVSSTSACNSAAGTPSHVLTAIGLDAESAGRTVRISVGRFTTEQDIDFAIACFRHAIEQCRSSASSGLTASRQITPDDLKAIRSAGFRAVICNRPDGESADQPAFEEIAAAARELGLDARYLPVESDQIGDAQVDAFGAMVDALPKPVLAYCGSGKRAGMLWSRLVARRMA
ncbi:aminotransferase class V-fold PLP-dependent enzyme [Burkholderia stagnalis]|uniref:aminotransferase class V-fold PLP-dependent enzyme n=1 Tax=Burkholderia stagnalis TaxID=1503054 RepID=UPI000F598657|nr:aminotransferase class V-fold PLP-dependent enzyme [Burkholderia stagnalis]RQQ07213.1 aminotransferase class V-fold PLP-dependent enzyme [Burkholderia stagnalis]RQQ35640.1 aminotransferase class V-fold PLP-dependent enzyme [Burkholderia stagnalis]RQY27531.1 aminotransferase class V-fold PLP-dependent enzyme [Burkholderia stagnalis]RQY43858.1 aminotransferase class V-fold PLP-dependent enzyme [Burkholderia stagnalis]RQY60661.1 aminotransferase class V-fold PLP-dependent enzyme [Burkholderia 